MATGSIKVRLPASLKQELDQESPASAETLATICLSLVLRMPRRLNWFDCCRTLFNLWYKEQPKFGEERLASYNLDKSVDSFCRCGKYVMKGEARIFTHCPACQGRAIEALIDTYILQRIDLDFHIHPSQSERIICTLWSNSYGPKTS